MAKFYLRTKNNPDNEESVRLINGMLLLVLVGVLCALFSLDDTPKPTPFRKFHPTSQIELDKAIALGYHCIRQAGTYTCGI